MKARTGSYSSIDEYIAASSLDVQDTLRRIRTTIASAAPDASEAIKYGLPTFVLGGNLVHFGAFKNHIGFYPTPSGIRAFHDELSMYPVSKGSVQFPFDKPVPYDLISRIVLHRVAEVRATRAK